MDARASTAAYYDLAPDFPADIPFYLGQLSPESTVLELGCGTGRVSAAVAPRVRFLHGIDLSPAMIARCRARLRDAGVTDDRATAAVGDITELGLGRRFDWIIAPYRVFQNLATDREVSGVFATIRAHLAPGGQCILDTFCPYADPATLVEAWRTGREAVDWELPVDRGRVVCSVRRAGVSTDPLVLHPELIYRRYDGLTLVDEATGRIAMRCWYPAELVARIESEGFSITGRWGGYAGERFGVGSELLVRFTPAS
jgi:SAM-dependent methyltransferase